MEENEENEEYDSKFPADFVPPIIQWGKDTPTVSIKWLWKPFIPFGKVSIVQGDGGDGKTTMILNIAALLSQGIAPPSLVDGELEQDPEVHEPITTFYLTNEDEVADSSLVRFKRFGGNDSHFAFSRELIHHMTLTEPELLSAIEQSGAKFVIIDPFQSFLPDGTSLASVVQMRKVSTALSNVAKETGAAIVLVGHLNKNESSKDIHRGLGSVDIANAARSIITVFADKDDPRTRYMRATKSNFDEGDTKTKIQIVMDENKQISYRVVPPEKPHTDAAPLEISDVDRAADILSIILAPGPCKYQTIKSVMDEHGISEKTAQRAKKKIGADAYRAGGYYYWELPLSDFPSNLGADEGYEDDEESADDDSSEYGE